VRLRVWCPIVADRNGRKLYLFVGMSTEGSVLLKSMFKASLVASAVFAIAWFRAPIVGSASFQAINGETTWGGMRVARPLFAISTR
jgi:hypothetical protein